MSAGPLVLSVNGVLTQDGDGVVGDAAVFAELGCRAACVTTAVLATSAEALRGFLPVPVDVIRAQFEAASSSGRPAGARVGVVRGAPQVELIAELLSAAAPHTTVCAPILNAGGSPVLDQETLDALRRSMFPVVRVLVIRAADLRAHTGRDAEDVDGLQACTMLLRGQGARAVVVAGLLARGRVIDLVDDDGQVAILDSSRIHAPYVPGLTGAYAAALAAHLARGAELRGAAAAAQRYVALRLNRAR